MFLFQTEHHAIFIQNELSVMTCTTETKNTVFCGSGRRASEGACTTTGQQPRATCQTTARSSVGRALDTLSLFFLTRSRVCAVSCLIECRATRKILLLCLCEHQTIMLKNQNYYKHNIYCCCCCCRTHEHKKNPLWKKPNAHHQKRPTISPLRASHRDHVTRITSARGTQRALLSTQPQSRTFQPERHPVETGGRPRSTCSWASLVG